MKRRLSAIIMLAAIVSAAACGGPPGNDAQPSGSGAQLSGSGAQQPGDNTQQPGHTEISNAEREKMTLDELTKNTIKATIAMDDGAVIEIELYPDLAPQSVRNFVSLARSGYYDGLKFHRIISGFMIQGGCPDGTGMGNPGYRIKGEFEKNGFKNDLSHTPGVLSMARSNDFDSAGSQFFIVHGDATFLDGGYAAFGKVTSGQPVVDELAQTPVLDGNGTVAPDDMPVIRSITIDDDTALPEPEKLG